MGTKLLLYYKYICDIKGLSGQMELAKATKIPSTQAAAEPDSSENVGLFKKAVAEITGRPAPTY